MALSACRRLAVLASAVAIGGLMVAGCGGNDKEGNGSSDEDAVVETIKDFAVGSAPDGDADVACERLTENLRAQAGGGDAAQCEKSLTEAAEGPSFGVDDVNVTDVKVDGEKATANAAIKGQSSVGAFTLVKEGDTWKIDGFEGGN